MNKKTTKNTKPNLKLPLLLAVILSACTQNNSMNANQSATSQDDGSTLVGCYTINQGTPAQIKISQDNGQFVMQMKEKTGGWDNPEPMKLANKEAAWQFFAVNSIALNKSDVGTIITRTDDNMLIAQLIDSASATNPYLDSDFVINIFGATNTVYSVACDDIPVDFDKMKHSPIT